MEATDRQKLEEIRQRWGAATPGPWWGVGHDYARGIGMQAIVGRSKGQPVVLSATVGKRWRAGVGLWWRNEHGTLGPEPSRDTEALLSAATDVAFLLELADRQAQELARLESLLNPAMAGRCR